MFFVVLPSTFGILQNMSSLVGECWTRCSLSSLHGYVGRVEVWLHGWVVLNTSLNEYAPVRLDGKTYAKAIRTSACHLHVLAYVMVQSVCLAKTT